uniref:Uncharacterized protein n=1 Tax=Parascaris equorum TaxID=6256 RepID=A0A914RGC5_PAREQ
MLLGERIAVMACVCCKCTGCKCGSAFSKKKKPNVSANAESSALETPHDPSDEDETYHIRGERHIPKKVYKPILKPPRSRRDSRQGRSDHKQEMVAIPQDGGLYAVVKSDALETEVVEKSVDLDKHQMDYIDANVDEVMESCRKGVTMKRGFKQLFSQERTVRLVNNLSPWNAFLNTLRFRYFFS